MPPTPGPTTDPSTAPTITKAASNESAVIHLAQPHRDNWGLAVDKDQTAIQLKLSS